MPKWAIMELLTATSPCAPAERAGLVSCHLGGSSSLCAILDGKSVDNSFGLSLQTGIPHNDRVGDLDPYIILYLQEQGLSPEEISLGLRTRSGLKGISGLSGDMRDIEEAMDSGDSRAKLAFDMYADAVARYIGAYTVELGGLDQVVFTGGIGENSWRLRAEVLQKIACLGVSFDEEANRTLIGEGILYAPDSTVTVRVIPPTKNSWWFGRRMGHCAKREDAGKHPAP